MKRCVIITGYIEGSIRNICPELFDSSASKPLTLCADGGYRLAAKEGLIPQVIIGDFDTFDGMETDVPEAGQIIRVPVEKDDTDTLLCIKYGLEQGCDSFLIIGGIGGRLDHTFANLQSLAYLTSHGAEVVMKDEETCVTMLSSGVHTLRQSDYRRFSLFAWSPTVEDLSIRGSKYELEHGKLENTFPLGVSNEFTKTDVELSFHSGMMLVIMNHQR